MAVRKPLPGRDPRPRSLGADVAYTAEQIQVLEGREHVRRRPSMYIGSTSATGLHGVGVSAVNFLSQRLQVWVHRGGKVYHQEYERGVPKAGVKPVGKTDRTGTIVRFWPDPQIFPETKFDREVILHRLREMAYL